MESGKFNDRGYKMLFSHPAMVEDLIRSFVREEFVEHIDFSTLARASASFVTTEFREREADIIWTVEYNGQPVYLYILIEFQSTVDPYMALRVLLYILLLYQELLRRPEAAARKLPPVFPIVLFNGKEKWTAPLSLADLIEPISPALSHYIPSFRYFKIAENEFSEEALRELNSLSSHLFMIETGDVKRLGQVVESIRNLLDRGADSELTRSLGIWIRRFFEKKRIDAPVDIETMTGQEVRIMLEARLQEFEDEAVKRGKLEGTLEGTLEGRRMVAQALLTRGMAREEVMEVTGLSDEEMP